MRIFNIVIAIAALLMIGMTGNPATANCHPKLEKAEEKLSAIPKDMPVRQQIKKKIAKAKKFKNHKKKKKKCKAILKNAFKLIKKAGKQAGKEGIGGCVGLIKKAEEGLDMVPPQNAKRSGWVSNIVEAKKFNAAGKNRECAQLMKKTIKQTGNVNR